MDGTQQLIAPLPVDPDVESEPAPLRLAVLAVIAGGGALGALTRYGVDLTLPTADGQFPWSTFLINVTGCLLIGLLLVWVVELGGAHELVRPFLAVGVLGGYTTMSTYATDGLTLALQDQLWSAFGYLAGTLVAALLAAQAGIVLMRYAGHRLRGRRARRT